MRIAVYLELDLFSLAKDALAGQGDLNKLFAAHLFAEFEQREIALELDVLLAAPVLVWVSPILDLVVGFSLSHCSNVHRVAILIVLALPDLVVDDVRSCEYNVPGKEYAAPHSKLRRAVLESYGANRAMQLLPTHDWTDLKEIFIVNDLFLIEDDALPAVIDLWVTWLSAALSAHCYYCQR